MYEGIYSTRCLFVPDGSQSISGSGVIDYRFEVQQCGEGVCVTYPSLYGFEGQHS